MAQLPESQLDKSNPTGKQHALLKPTVQGWVSDHIRDLSSKDHPWSPRQRLSKLKASLGYTVRPRLKNTTVPQFFRDLILYQHKPKVIHGKKLESM